MAGPGTIAPISIGNGELVVIAGPCVIESEERTDRIARGLQGVCSRVGLPLIFKASFDFRGLINGINDCRLIFNGEELELKFCLT